MPAGPYRRRRLITQRKRKNVLLSSGVSRCSASACVGVLFELPQTTTRSAGSLTSRIHQDASLGESLTERVWHDRNIQVRSQAQSRRLFVCAPVECARSCADNDVDEVLIGVVNGDDTANLQRDNPELRSVMDYIEGRESAVPRVFARHLSGFVIRKSVLLKKKLGTSTISWLLVVPTSLRKEIFQGWHEPHNGTSICKR